MPCNLPLENITLLRWSRVVVQRHGLCTLELLSNIFALPMQVFPSPLVTPQTKVTFPCTVLFLVLP